MSFWQGVTSQMVSEAEDGFGMFAIGDNKAYIKSVQEKTSQAGNPMLVVAFANEEGAEIKHYIIDNEYKLSNIKRLCVAFDIPYEDYIYHNRWANKKGIVVCKEEEYNGKKYPKVSWFKPLSQPQPHGAAQPQQGSEPKPRDFTEWDQPQTSIDVQFTDDIPF